MSDESSDNTARTRQGASFSRWFRYLPEGLMVLFGVMLAFLMEDYREERERQQLADAAIQRVNLEVANNFSEVIAMHAITRERLAKLESLEPGPDDETPFTQLIPKFTGYRFLQTDRSAWSGMQLGSYFDKIPHDYVADVFVLYDSNDVLKSLDGRVADLVFGADVHDPKKTATVWAISRAIMDQQVIWSGEAIRSYCEFMQKWAPKLYDERENESPEVMGEKMPSLAEVCQSEKE